MSEAVKALFLFLFALFLTVFLTWRILPRLRRRKMGQTILEIGPKWHKSKEGTPTMGGIVFLFTVPLTVFCGSFLLPPGRRFALWMTLLFAFLQGAVGVIDDWQKLRNHRNEGLLPWQKIFLQTLISGFYLAMMQMAGELETNLLLPFSPYVIPLGPFYYFAAMVLLVGVVNCANLTDGIDGLAASVALLIGLFFLTEGVLAKNPENILLSSSLCGVTAGFLFFNFHPAKIFMGDTGSLFLGALGAGCAFLLRTPFLILLAGLVYVLEGCSVILQVFFFKLTGKRLFRMAPLHHHFEKKGWSEPAIVTLFSLITLASLALAHFLLPL